MKIYLAPMEGITGHVYRRVFEQYFGTVDKYFTPFLAPNQTRSLKKRELREIAPEHNKGISVVPQILTRQAEDFLWTAEKLAELGYSEVNLNLGCPSATVVPKGKGSGFLAFPEELDRFLDNIYSRSPLPISIKTRLGKDDPDEFHRIMEIFRKYPLAELIIHPRIQKDFYGKLLRLDYFELAKKQDRIPLCYNGDIFTVESWKRLKSRYEDIDTVMLGRGLLTNPGLAGELKGHAPITKTELRGFLDTLYCEYINEYRDSTILNRMKELWSYQVFFFEDPMFCRRKIRKANSFSAYEAAVDTIFREQEPAVGAGFPGGINPQE